MDWPYHFPHPAEEIARVAAALRQSSVEERMDRLLDLIASGRALAADPEAHRRWKARTEGDWQRAHREVFDRHAR